MGAKFGPAGNPARFYDEGHKSSHEMPAWLSKMGLTAYEYQCGKGVTIGEKTAGIIGESAKEQGIAMSLHAPYFISLSSQDEALRQKSVQYILDSLRAARWMGATRIVVHSGSCGKMSREEALFLAQGTLSRAVEAARAEGYDDIFICPETMGKINQLGTLEEVIALCSLSETLVPTVDFGHLNARTLGGLKSYGDFLKIFESIENALGADRLKKLHCHFSKIEYTSGGEKRHLTLEDEIYGPDFLHAAEIIAQKNLSPVVICESAGTQADDALILKNLYEGMRAS